eukprot:1873567-Prymnesium_polylepis.1
MIFKAGGLLDIIYDPESLKFQMGDRLRSQKRRISISRPLRRRHRSRAACALRIGGDRPHVFRSMPRPDRARMGGTNAARIISRHYRCQHARFEPLTTPWS